MYYYNYLFIYVLLYIANNGNPFDREKRCQKNQNKILNRKELRNNRKCRYRKTTN